MSRTTNSVSVFLELGPPKCSHDRLSAEERRVPSKSFTTTLALGRRLIERTGADPPIRDRKLPADQPCRWILVLRIFLFESSVLEKLLHPQHSNISASPRQPLTMTAT